MGIFLPLAIAALIAVAAVAAIGVGIIAIRNKLVTLSARVDNCWAQIDVQLKKRYDLIPNLIETVKGSAAYERSVLEQVTALRTGALSAATPRQVMEAEGKLSQGLSGLLATAEHYPDLKANQNFLALQGQLQEVERKIAFSRQFYNDTVMRYNEALMKFPSGIIANIFNFEERPYYQAFESERDNPKVGF